jgi:hypothetical protein
LGYDARQVNSRKAGLISANTHEDLLGLFTTSHGQCQGDKGWCSAHTGDALDYYIGDPCGTYAVAPHNDWQRLKSSSRRKLRRMYVGHCLADMTTRDHPTIKRWFAARLGMIGADYLFWLPVTDASGMCNFGEHATNLWQFVLAFRLDLSTIE